MGGEDWGKVGFDVGVRKVKGYVKGGGKGGECGMRSVEGGGMEVSEIIDVSGVGEKGCGGGKRRRV